MLAASLPEYVLRFLRNLEGPAEGRDPGLKPSISLQVGIKVAPTQAFKPKLPPAIPIKFFIFSFSEGPTE
jgi:hypothetical protein